MSLSEIIEIARALRWWLALIVLGFGGLAVGLALSIKPTYRATVVVVEARQDQVAGGLSGIASRLSDLGAIAGIQLPQQDSPRREALATLRSRQFILEFVDAAGIAPVLFPEGWNTGRRTWLVSDPDDFPTRERQFKKFSRMLTVSEDLRTELISVSVDWGDPEVAAKWANEIVRRLNAKMRERAIDDARSAIRYLNDEVEKTNVVETRAALFRLVEVHLGRAALASTQSDFALRVLDPAVAPDRDDFFRPRRLLISAAGFAFGVCVAAGVVLAALFLRLVRRGATSPGR